MYMEYISGWWSSRHYIFFPHHFVQKFLLEMFTSMSSSAPKACARSQQTPILAPEKGDVWSIKNEEHFAKINHPASETT